MDVILPMSKYAGGDYTNPKGMDFDELAPIMQEELDRRGSSRRTYTGDMLFQHYYQKCSARSYKRGEGDHIAVPNGTPRSRAPSGSMGPPSRPTSGRRPAKKRTSMNNTYNDAFTQTNLAIEAGSEPELALQDYPQYSGRSATLFEAIAAESNLEVRPPADSTNKRKYQAFVRDEEEEDLFTLNDASLEAEMQPIVRKTKTRVRTNAREAETRTEDAIFTSMDEISNLLGHRPSEPERQRPVKLQNPWENLFGTRSSTPLGRARRFASPISDTQSAGTDRTAYRTYTPTPSFELPSSASDTGRPSRYRRSLARSILLEEASRPPSRASNGGNSIHGTWGAPLSESSRNSNREELDTSTTSRIIRCPRPRVRPSEVAYGEDSHFSDYIRSPQRESSRAAAHREESQTSNIPRSSSRLSAANFTPNYEEEDESYLSRRIRSSFEPTRDQGLGARKQQSEHEDDDDEEPICRFGVRSSRFSPAQAALEARPDDTPTPVTTLPKPLVTSNGRTPLPSFRKRSKLQDSTSSPASTEQQRTTRPSRPTKRRVSFNPFPRLDDE